MFTSKRGFALSIGDQLQHAAIGDLAEHDFQLIPNCHDGGASGDVEVLAPCDVGDLLHQRSVPVRSWADRENLELGGVGFRDVGIICGGGACGFIGNAVSYQHDQAYSSWASMRDQFISSDFHAGRDVPFRLVVLRSTLLSRRLDLATILAHAILQNRSRGVRMRVDRQSDLVFGFHLDEIISQQSNRVLHRTDRLLAGLPQVRRVIRAVALSTLHVRIA